MILTSLMVLIIAIAITPNSEVLKKGVGGISPILLARLTSIVFLFSGALTFNALYIQSIGSGLSLFSGLFQVTVLSQSIDLILFILGSLILIPWSNNYSPSIAGAAHGPHGHHKIITYLTGPVVSEYSLIVLFTTLGSSLLLSSGNLLSMYLAVELQSFGVYILATIYRNSESATNAGLKYFLLGGLSSCLILLGCVLIYSYTGIISFEEIYSLITSSAFIDNPLFKGQGITGNDDIITTIQLGLILIFIGFLFKIAGAPFHNWAPDVYNDVPTIVTTWLTIMPKIAIIILSFEIISTINIDSLLINSHTLDMESTITLSSAHWAYWASSSFLKNLLLISSLLSLIIGTIVGLAQVKIKRLLAYSTISHVGFLLLALSINTEDSLESLIFYLIQYSFTNLNTFFILLAFGYIIKKSIDLGPMSNSKGNIANGAAQGAAQAAGAHVQYDINLISELKGQFVSNPLLSLSLAVCLFSMAGIPPLMGFFAKAQVLYSATQNGYYFISIVAILVSVISAYYYLQIVKVLHFDNLVPVAQCAEGPLSVNMPFGPNSNSKGISFISNDLYMPSSAQGAHCAALGSGSYISPNILINNTHSYIISTLTLSLLLFMLKPSILLNSIHLLALNIFYS